MMRPHATRRLSLILVCVLAIGTSCDEATADKDVLPAVSLQEAAQLAADYIEHKHSGDEASKLPVQFQPFMSSARLVGAGSASPYWEIRWIPRGRFVRDGDFTLAVAMDRSVRVLDPGK